jgi:peptide/nickel transport system permease protein
MAQLMWEQFLEHKLAVISLGIILIFCLVAASADLISMATNIDPNAGDIFERYAPPSAQHWLGTDEAGRDVLMRLVYGTRVSMMVAIFSTLSAAVIGIVVGALAGYFGGWVDTILMRVTDALLSLPTIPILIILAAIDINLGFIPGDPSIIKMIIIMVAFSWMVQARLVRGAVLSVRNQEYILSAKTLGMSHSKIIYKEILPNVFAPVIVAVTLNVGANILYEAAISFLGMGIQPPIPSWGNMLTNAQELIYSAPMLAVIPGLLILAVVVAFNFLGDGLQEALDPKAIRR